MSYNSGGSGSSKSSGLGFAGFTMPKRNPSNVSLHAVPPPSSGLSKQGYSTMTSITANALTGSGWGGVGKKRSKTEDEYFDEDEEPAAPALAYIPAPGSPSYNAPSSASKDEDEEDPLDAFMAGLEQQAAKDMVSSKEAGRGTRGDIEQEDDEESYYRYMEENPLGNSNEGSDEEIEYDADGNPIPPAKKKFIDPLPPIDHTEMQYEPFEKNFYTPHEEIEKLSREQVEELKKALGVKITGPDPPKPVTSFAHFNFDEALMKMIRKSEFTQPTPVQAAGIPAALSGRDMIEIKKRIERRMNVDRNVRVVREVNMKECYVKMYETCLLFSESQGVQILLAYARLLVDAVSVIGFFASQKAVFVLGLPVGPFILQSIDMVLLIGLLFYANSLLQTSKEIYFVMEKGLVKNDFDSERERAAWEEFVQLVHRCPLVLTAYDFFPLDYSLLGATFGTIVTYTIILTQLN